VKQRIQVLPDRDFDDGTVLYYGTPDISDYSRKAVYELKEVSSRAVVVNNNGKKTYIASTSIQGNVYRDLDNRNVVLNLVFVIQGTVGSETDPFVGLDSANINDLANFKNSFKIVYSRTEYDKEGQIGTPVNVVETITYLDIREVKGISNPVPDGTTTVIDTLRITIAPAYQYVTPLNNGAWVRDPGFTPIRVYVYEPYVGIYDGYYPWGWYYQNSNSESPIYVGNNNNGNYYTISGKWVTETYYLLINDGLGYTGGKYVFGNPDNFGNGGFERYNISQ
jgi:hypothetical protein